MDIFNGFNGSGWMGVTTGGLYSPPSNRMTCALCGRSTGFWYSPTTPNGPTCNDCWSAKYIEGIQEEVIIQELTTKEPMFNAIAKRFLDKDTKTLIKAGFLTNDLLVTNDGRSALYSILMDKFKTELVAEAEEVIKDREEECK